jgi:hypothetical protein
MIVCLIAPMMMLIANLGLYKCSNEKPGAFAPGFP